MKWKEYPYTIEIHQRFGFVQRAQMQVRLSNGDSDFWPISLIDSGAFATMINAEVAPILGINLEPCTEVRVGGVGSTVGKLCDVTIEFPDFGVKEKVTAIFVKDLPFNVLLGQNDFFRLFDVRFEQTKGKFYIRKAGK